MAVLLGDQAIPRNQHFNSVNLTLKQWERVLREETAGMDGRTRRSFAQECERHGGLKAQAMRNLLAKRQPGKNESPADKMLFPCSTK